MENAALQSFTISAACVADGGVLVADASPWQSGSCSSDLGQRWALLLWIANLPHVVAVLHPQRLRDVRLEVNLVETLSAGRPSENLSCETCKMVCGLVSPSQAFLTTHRFALFLLGFTFVNATCMCAFHSTKSKECNRHAECARSVPPCRPVAPTACAQ